MSDLAILVIGLCSIAGLVLVTRAWLAKEQLKAQTDLVKAKRYQAMQAKSAQVRRARAGVVESGTPEWIGDLLESLGIDSGILDSEEMPPEVEKLLPLAEGFLQSGMGKRILGKLQGGEPLGEDEIAAAGDYA